MMKILHAEQDHNVIYFRKEITLLRTSQSVQMYLKIETFHLYCTFLEFFYIADLYFAMSYKGCSFKSYYARDSFKKLQRIWAIEPPIHRLLCHDKRTRLPLNYRVSSRLFASGWNCRWNVLVNYRLLANSTETTIMPVRKIAMDSGDRCSRCSFHCNRG